MTTASNFFARSRRNAREFIDAAHAVLADLEEYQKRGGDTFTDNVDDTEYESYGTTLATFNYYMAQLATYKANLENPDSTRENALMGALYAIADAE